MLQRAADRVLGNTSAKSRAVVFDAMGTLFDLSELDERFAAIGAPPTVRRAWFSRLLDSARALTLVGEFAPFDELARSTLRATLAQENLDPDSADDIAEGLSGVGAYPDAEPALERLAEMGIPAVVLTNGGMKQTEQLLEKAGIDGAISHVFSTDEVQAYKPDARPYRFVHERLGIPVDGLTLVAAHGWDVLGARAAGFEAVWVDRLELQWPFPLPEPEFRAPDLLAAATMVTDRLRAEQR